MGEPCATRGEIRNAYRSLAGKMKQREYSGDVRG
jgi:hypothetical protein